MYVTKVCEYILEHSRSGNMCFLAEIGENQKATWIVRRIHGLSEGYIHSFSIFQEYSAVSSGDTYHQYSLSIRSLFFKAKTVEILACVI